MAFAGKVWRLLVGIKDALALLFLLLFFTLLFAMLTSRPSPGVVRGGALLIELDGSIVEEASEVDPLEILLSGTLPTKEYELRDIVRALDAAAEDDRIDAVVLDLSEFLGGGHVHMQEVGDALDRVRAVEKEVLTFGLAFGDDSLMIAAHSSEAWVDPLGGAAVMGPGGTHLYYKRLFDEFDVTGHIYRAGTYKSAVEPYMLTGMSPEARENANALYSSVWEEYQANLKRARPEADFDAMTKDVLGWVAEHKGDLAAAAVKSGLVDKIGTREEFGNRVAELVGEDSWNTEPGSFLSTELEPFLAAHKPSSSGKAIGVITIAGEISDGKAGPGNAGAERIVELLDDALDDDLAALVVRVDSPGGTLTGSEAIRRAIMRHKAKGIPIAVSMANYAASGGYWVATPGDRIFAEPETVTGSIGVYAFVPSFEGTLKKFGVDADGVRTTPLSGQPDFLGGFSPEVNAVLQGGVEHDYEVFLKLVADARGKSRDEIDRVAQGQVWDGGTGRQIGLVDQFGDLDDAIAWAAGQAKLEEGKWHAKFFGTKRDPYASLIQRLLGTDTEAENAAAPRDIVGMMTLRQQDLFGRVAADVERLFTTRGVQAYCLECMPFAPADRSSKGPGPLTVLGRLFGS